MKTSSPFPSVSSKSAMPGLQWNWSCYPQLKCNIWLLCWSCDQILPLGHLSNSVIEELLCFLAINTRKKCISQDVDELYGLKGLVGIVDGADIILH
jgi:hypothetical protein